MRSWRVCILLLICQFSFAQEKDLLPTLRDVIRFRSVSGNEKPLAEYLLNKSKEMGFFIETFADRDSFLNFSASLYPLSQGKPNIVFLCHLDVVSAGDSAQWRNPPFSGMILRDTLWGRGCLDMKATGVMELFALRRFLDSAKAKNYTHNVSVLFVSDEETGGMHGAKFITENHLKLLNPEVVIGEGGAGFKKILPSKPEKLVFFVSVAEKKSLWLKLSVEHKTNGHGAMATDETANSILLRGISRVREEKPIIIFDKVSKHMFKELGKMNRGFKGFLLRNINAFWLRPFRRKILNSEPMLLNEVTSTTQLTSINNPQAPPNVIASEATAYFDCRLLPGVKVKKFMRRLKRKLGDPRIKTEIIDQSPTAKPSPRKGQFETIASSLRTSYPNCGVLPVLFPATSDNSFFRYMDVATYGILPIELNQKLISTVHGPNECIPVPLIYKGVAAYRGLMGEFLKK